MIQHIYCTYAFIPHSRLCCFLLQVTVFQIAKNPGRPDSFTFTVDGSLRNMTAYITGASSLTFNLTSSTGRDKRHSLVMTAWPRFDSGQGFLSFRSVVFFLSCLSTIPSPIKATQKSGGSFIIASQFSFLPLFVGLSFGFTEEVKDAWSVFSFHGLPS